MYVKKGYNSSVRKEKMRILVFLKIGQNSYVFSGKTDNNSNVFKNRAKITMFGRKRS